MTQAMIGPMGMVALAGLLAFVILVGATTSACQQGVGPPAPPPPPDLTGRVLPKPPGSDDFAHRSFGHPLSLQDAEAVLRHTRVFEVGGMPPKRQVQAFNVVFEQADAVGRFRSIAEGESPAGTLYGFAALLLLDPTAAVPLRVSLSVLLIIGTIYQPARRSKPTSRTLRPVFVRRARGCANGITRFGRGGPSSF